MKFFKHISLVIAGILCSGMAAAEVNLIELSAAVWGTTMDGGFEAPEYGSGGYRVNTDDFDFKTETSSFFTIRVEGDNKYSPDIILSIVSAKHTGPGSISVSNNEYYSDNGSIDLSHAELSLYYSAFENDQIDINIGVSGKFFYGDFSLEDVVDSSNPNNTYQNISSDLSTELPMLFTRLDYRPLDYLQAYINLQGGSYDGQKGHDFSLGLDYIFKNNVGLGLGYREFQTVQSSEVEAGSGKVDLELDIKVSGGFLRIFYQQ